MRDEETGRRDTTGAGQGRGKGGAGSEEARLSIAGRSVVIRSVRSTWARGDESADETEPARDAMLPDEENIHDRTADCSTDDTDHDEESLDEERFADRCRSSRGAARSAGGALRADEPADPADVYGSGCRSE